MHTYTVITIVGTSLEEASTFHCRGTLLLLILSSHNNNYITVKIALSLQPVPLTDATHIVVPKEDHEKLQDELGKLTHEVDQSRKLEFEKEKEWREAKEARERHESDLMNCCRRISSQSPKNVDAVIQRSVAANQQVQANSTASLGRAEQLPQQERSRTLDAERSDFQQFLSVFEQVCALLLHSVLIINS